MGLITTRELTELGFDENAIRRFVRQGVLDRRHQGVYLIGDTPLTFHRKATAALLAVGGTCAICHVTALAHWYLRPEPEDADVHVATAGRGGREQRDGITIHRPNRLEATKHDGLPVTTATRTVLDVAHDLPRHVLFRILEESERQLLDIERHRIDGCAPLRQPLQVFDALGPCTRSDAEAMFLFDVCLDHGIPLPVVNKNHGGEEFDFRWPDARLIVEVDGVVFHDGQPRKGRRRFESDRSKGLKAEQFGHNFIRVSANQVAHHTADVAAAVLARLRAPGASGRP